MEKSDKFIVITGLEISDYSPSELDLILIPQPKKISYNDIKTRYKFTSNPKISIINYIYKEVLYFEFKEFLEQISDLHLSEKERDITEIRKNMNLEEKDLIESDYEGSYFLEISDSKILIYSETNSGLFYGLQTLLQIIKNSIIPFEKNKAEFINIPEIKIQDFPDLGMRGVAQDISRGQICTVENAKRYIKVISHYKMNSYCLYIEDVFTHPDHPLIGKNRGALTYQEVREIDVYAKTHHVNLIPIFECLGHVDNILQHKEYRSLGEFPSAQSLDLSNPEIYPLLEDYVSLMSESFSTKYFHIGCDESFDVGKLNSKDLIELKGKSEVLVHHYNKLYNMVKSCNNDYVIMYDDIVRKDDKILNRLNKDMILMYWEYNPEIKNPPVQKFIDAGFKVIISPSMLNWNRNFPDNKNASQNIINMVDIAYNFHKEGCLGVLTSTWGDQRYFSLRENEIFGAVLSADKTWNVNNFNYELFKKKYGFLFYGLERNYLDKFSQLFTLLSSSAEYYYRLRLILPPLFYTDFFKHPFYSRNIKPAIKNYLEFKNLGKKCLEIYNSLIPHVIFEIQNFEYIQFAAELVKYCGEKIEISIDITEELKKKTLTQKDIDNCIEKIIYVRDKIKYLRNKYETLWLYASKRPCLDENLEMFDHLIGWYDQKLWQLKNNILFKNPYLKSEWIWAKEKTPPKKPRYFRKKLIIKKEISLAIIQASVCNYMKIYINGHNVGELLGRFSLSRLPILLRVKTFDISDLLKKGENIIAIEAHNYDGFKGAFNLYGQIEYVDRTIQEIFSNSTWKSFKKRALESAEWIEIDFNDDSWDGVKSYGPPPNLNGDIIKPNLLNGEKSLTQNYYGAQGYYFAGVEIFFGKIIRFFLKYLIGFIIKRARLFG